MGVVKFDHMGPVLESLYWLPVDYHTKFKVLCMAYKSLHGLASSYLADLIKPHAPKWALHSTDQNLLTVPKIWTNKYGSHAFEFAAPNLFNSLLGQVHLAPSYETFKGRLKTYFFQAALVCV